MISIKMKYHALFFILLVVVCSITSSGQRQYYFTSYGNFYINSEYEPDSLQRIQLKVKRIKQYDDSSKSKPSRIFEYDKSGRRIRDSQLITADNGAEYWRTFIYFWSNTGSPKKRILCESFDEYNNYNCTLFSSELDLVFDSDKRLLSIKSTSKEGNSEISMYYYNNDNVLDSVITTKTFGHGIILNKDKLLSYKLSSNHQLTYSKYLTISYEHILSSITIDTSIQVRTFDTTSKRIVIIDYDFYMKKVIDSNTYIFDTINNVIKRIILSRNGDCIDCNHFFLDSNGRKIYSMVYNNRLPLATQFFTYNTLGLLEIVSVFQVRNNELQKQENYYFQYEYY